MGNSLKYIFTGLIFLIVYMSPYFILGENSYITIHDYLDQDVAIMENLKNNGLLTQVLGSVPNMEGLDRSLYQFFTPFDIKMLCIYLFPSFWAIMIYTYLLKAIAYVGMFFFCDRYLFERNNRWISTGLALALAIVPFYALHSISGVGLPLLIFAFLNLYYKRDVWQSFILIAVYSFNSWLAYGGFFALAILFVLLCYDWLKNRKIHQYVIFGSMFMCLFYLLANWGNIYSLLFSDTFVSQRAEFVNSSTIQEEFLSFVRLLMYSQYHAGGVVAWPIIAAFSFLIYKYGRKYSVLNKVAVLYILITLGIFIGMMLKFLPLHLFLEIQFDRFYFFYPAICFIMLASICLVCLKENKKKIVFVMVIFGLLSSFYNDHELQKNIYQIAGKEIKEPNYRQFYDKDLFSLIVKDLCITPNYQTKVVSVGMFPSIPEYNGLYTIDSYRVNYPVEFKHKFRRVIVKELDKNEVVQHYYDDWGSRCYVFSAELKEQGNQYLCSKMNNMSVEHLELNIDVLKELGCQYILSAVDIKNYKDMNLKYVNSYTTPESFWNIRVYQVN